MRNNEYDTFNCTLQLLDLLKYWNMSEVQNLYDGVLATIQGREDITFHRYRYGIGIGNPESCPILKNYLYNKLAWIWMSNSVQE